MSGGGDVGGWTPLQRSVVEAWKVAEGSRKISTGKLRVGERGSTYQIPSPFIDSCDIWETLCVVLGVYTARTHYPDTDRRTRARQPVFVGRTNPVR
jgi:hypothetical protein